jgi:hypothetical protein
MPTPKAPTTKPSTPKLSDVAQHVVAPKGAVTTGWPAVERKAASFGIRFRWWQKPIGRIVLSKRPDGKYASTIGGTGLSIPRQVGKTFLIGAIIFALCLLRPKLTVVWTAHRVRTAEETFGKMQAFAKRKRIAPFIANIVLGSGEEEITFRNGSRILFGARAAGFGRGFDEVDVVVFDEAQILTEAALDDIVPAMNQCRQPEGALLLFMGTPPKPTDPSEVWMRMRTEALSGEDDDTGWVEFGANADHVFTALPAPLSEADWTQIRQANPSFPDDTPRESILRMRKKLGSDSFRREGAGQYDTLDGKLILPRWPGCFLDTEAPPLTGIGLSVSIGGEHGSIASADVWEDGRVNLSAVDRRRGSSWLVAEAKRIQTDYGCPVALDEKCPDATLLPALIEAGVNVSVMKLNDYVEACSELVNRVADRTVTHQRTTYLDAAVTAAAWRPVGDGRRVFGRVKSSAPIDMLEAATFAMRAALVDAYDIQDSIG